MKIIKCVVVDDEPLARKGLEGYIEKVPFLEHIQSFKGAIGLQTFLDAHHIDLVFLDIEMPELTGMQLLKTQKTMPPVIFTTAYSEYAVESYQFDVIDYLVKPISLERFLLSANKAHNLLHKRINKTEELDHIFVKTDQGLEKVMTENILFIESMQNYIVIHTAEKKYMTLVPLKKIFSLLSAEHFSQVHKSYVIANNKVEGIVGNQVVINDEKIPVSERLRKQVVEKLTEGRYLKK